MNILTCPKSEVIRLSSELGVEHAIISIFDPGSMPVGFTDENVAGVLYLSFHDTEPMEGDSARLDIKLFDDNMAKNILDFFNMHRHLPALLVHCHGGFSRSVAIGNALSRLYHCPVGHYNPGLLGNFFVYDTVLKVGGYEPSSAFGPIEIQNL